MKALAKALILTAVVATGTLLTSCGTPFPLGCLYTKVYLPLGVGNGEMKYNRKGEAQCVNVFGWVATGDASLDAAVHNGQIKKISWATQRVENILGIYGTYTTIVYGFGDKADPSVAPENMLK